MGQSRPLFVYFRHFLITISIIEKSIDGVLGITRGCRMVGADETTELWRPPQESPPLTTRPEFPPENVVSYIVNSVYFLMGHSLSLFHYFRLFNTVGSKQMFNINFADDWIWTMDLWFQKRLLYQLSHNHCHILVRRLKIEETFRVWVGILKGPTTTCVIQVRRPQKVAFNRMRRGLILVLVFVRTRERGWPSCWSRLKRGLTSAWPDGTQILMPNHVAIVN